MFFIFPQKQDSVCSLEKQIGVKREDPGKHISGFFYLLAKTGTVCESG